MSASRAERAVIVARRNKKNAGQGMKIQRLIELRAAVTAALAVGYVPQPRATYQSPPKRAGA